MRMRMKEEREWETEGRGGGVGVQVPSEVGQPPTIEYTDCDQVDALEGLVSSMFG